MNCFSVAGPLNRMINGTGDPLTRKTTWTCSGIPWPSGSGVHSATVISSTSWYASPATFSGTRFIGGSSLDIGRFLRFQTQDRLLALPRFGPRFGDGIGAAADDAAGDVLARRQDQQDRTAAVSLPLPPADVKGRPRRRFFPDG